MNDQEMIELVYSLTHLPEYKRKEIAILLISTTLDPMSVEQVAGYMAGIADELLTVESDAWDFSLGVGDNSHLPCRWLAVFYLANE